MRTTLTFPFLLLALLAACAPQQAQETVDTPLLVYLQADPSGEAHLLARLPNPPGEGGGYFAAPQLLSFPLPAGCSLYDLYPSPGEYLLAAEFDCGGIPLVHLMDLRTAQVRIPSAAYEADTRFLAWSADEQYLYLKADSLGAPFILRVDVGREAARVLDLPETVYDMAALPDGDILYALTRGLGFGSEVWRAEADGRRARLLFAEPGDIVAYLRPSPDGEQVAYILLPDSPVPFPEGELWLRPVEGGEARLLAPADAGHGYAPAWAPDGSGIAFVSRLTSEPFTSQLSFHRFSDTSLLPLTDFSDAVVEAPAWAPGGDALAFTVVRNGTIQVWIEEFPGGEPLPLDETAVSCCAVWLPAK